MQIKLEKIVAKKAAPIHADEILIEEFLEPFGIAMPTSLVLPYISLPANQVSIWHWQG